VVAAGPSLRGFGLQVVAPPTSQPTWPRKVFKESGIGLGGSVLGTALNYGVLLTVTRFLTPDEFGVFSLAQSIVGVFLIFGLCGTPRALDRFIPYYSALGETGKVKGLIRDVMRMTTLLEAVVAVLLLALAGWLATAVFDNPGMTVVLRLMVLSIPTLGFIELVGYAFVGYKDVRYRVYTYQIAVPAFKLAMAAVCLSLGYGLIGWVWAYIVSLFLASMLALSFFRRRIGQALRGTAPRRIDLREVMSYSWPLSINSLVLMFSGQVGILLLGHFRPAADVGVFQVYVYMVLVMQLALNAFSQIYKPVAAEFASHNDHSTSKELFSRVGKWMLVSGSFVGLVVIVFGRDVVELVFPSSYGVATSALLILAVGRTAISSLGPQGMALEAHGDTRLSMLNGLLMVSVNVGLAFLLIPRYGIVGAAVASSAATLGAAVAGLIEVAALHRLHPFNLPYWKALAVAGAAGIITWLLKVRFPLGGLGGLATMFAVLAVLYAGGLMISGALDSTDCDVLRRVWSRMPGVARRETR
jgi:O-antigen/teichoic acid export membrane protein